MISFPLLICLANMVSLSSFTPGQQCQYLTTGFSIVSDTLEDPADTVIYDAPDIPAVFSKKIEWREFLATNLKASVPVDNGAPNGAYTVIIMFVVNKDGSLEGFKPLTNHGYGMEDETIRVLKLGPKWQPARKDNKPVRAFQFQKMTFFVSGY